jgi:glycosyltransferase involved in cell wall biosynthesis
MRSHSPVLAANAFSFQRADAGLLYGQDLLIETLAALVPPQGALSNVGLVIHQAQPETAHGHEFAGVQERARALGVQDRVFWVHDSAPFGPTLVRADALLRPTSTDGDAVSVREALHLGVPVVASAVVQRPPGVIAVAEREPTRWALAVTQALAAAAGAPCEVPQDDSFATIWALYQRLTGPSTATPR